MPHNGEIKEFLSCGRIEVCQKSSSTAKKDVVKQYVGQLLTKYAIDELFYDKKIEQFDDSFLAEHVDSISFCDMQGGGIKAVELSQLDICVYQLYHSSMSMEELDCEENISAGTHWILPSTQFEGLWESLVYEDDVKQNLLQYARTNMLFADRKVDANIVSCNRLLLLHGPPGTGKTSLCKALAHKLSITLSDRYRHGQLLEINSHSLFSKWFSESGKLVMQMFQKIQEFVSDPEAFVCILIDEVESLSASRQNMTGSEPSDAIRVVNALLTQLDTIKRYPNVLILTTSNITDAIDNAFLDRADIRQFIGLPSGDGIYQILYSCIQELIRVKIVTNSDNLLHPLALRALQRHGDLDLMSDTSVHQSTVRLQQVALGCAGLSGRALRKLPFVAHSLYVQKQSVSLGHFLDALMLAAQRQLTDKSAAN